MRAVVADVEAIERELGRASEPETIRGQLHQIKGAERVVTELAERASRRGGSLRRWGTFAFAGIAAVTALRPWELLS